MLTSYADDFAMTAPGPLLIDLDGPRLTPEEISLLKDPLIGGVIFFSRNFESCDQLLALTSAIRTIRSDLLLCVDQEGGRVQRFRAGFSRLPALGRIEAISRESGLDPLRLVSMHAFVMASELKQVGLDFSFTPVVDINYGHNEVVGDRSFGPDLQQVVSYGCRYAEALYQAGMAAIAKHFPGHGYVTEDTHIKLALDPRTKAELLAKDMLPFKALIELGVAGIMPAHVIYPQVDALPAVQSSHWIKQVLRVELGFEGAVIGDDLGMAGAAGGRDPGEKVVQAVEAGCDLVMVCNNRKALTEALKALHGMNEDHFTEQRCERRRALLADSQPGRDVNKHSDFQFSLEEARSALRMESN